MKYPNETDEHFAIDVLNRVTWDAFEGAYPVDPVEVVLMG